MGIGMRNSEGYADPTAGSAISRVRMQESRGRFWPIVYVCSPFKGDVAGNAARARRYCRFAYTRGAMPIAPHLLFPQFMDDGDEEERKAGLTFGLLLLDRCAEVWVFGDTVSEGMAEEIARARRKGKPVRYFTEDFKEAWPI